MRRDAKTLRRPVRIDSVLEEAAQDTMKANKNVALKGRDLAISLLVLLLVVYTLFILARAWLASSDSPHANQMGMTLTGIDNVNFQLYLFDEDIGENGTWVPQDKLDFSLAVPNELRRYKIVAGTAFHSATFSFTGVDSLEKVDTKKLTDYIFLYEDAVTDEVLATYTETQKVPFDAIEGNAGMNLASRMGESTAFAVNGTTDSTYYFDIYLAPQVCNCFAQHQFYGTLILSN